jgi:hypothetical protein
MLTNTYPLWFCNGDGLAMTNTVPTASLPIYAGGPFTIKAFMGPSPWPGNDGIAHIIWNIGTMAEANNLQVIKDVGNNLYFTIFDGAGNYRLKYVAVNATNWPVGGYRAIMASRDALGNLTFYLDRTNITGSASTGTGLETALATVIAFGATAVPDFPINMPAYYSFSNRVATPAEWLADCDLMGVA